VHGFEFALARLFFTRDTRDTRDKPVNIGANASRVILPDTYYMIRSACPDGRSQSLLRQRILPDIIGYELPVAATRKSQSLLRQRILPDKFAPLVRLSDETPVSIASSSANTPGPTLTTLSESVANSKSQSLLRQRILPDRTRRPPARTSSSESQSLLRQRILPDTAANKGGDAAAQKVSIASSSANTPGQ
jgi:hypothetical protein